MKNPVGRPANPNALKKVGKRFNLLLDTMDRTKLKFLAEYYNLGEGEVLRKLLREEYNRLKSL